MRLLETWVANPLAWAVGWTLLHSLWEGAIVAIALAAALAVMRSPRARYAVACVALLAIMTGFGITLVRVMPSDSGGMRVFGTPAQPGWNVGPGPDAAGPLDMGLAAMVPWLAPFWMTGVCIFYLGHAAGWISVRRLRWRGVCCAPDEWRDRLASLSVQLRVSRPILLLESCLADAPMVLGHFRPVILVPIGLLAGLPATQVEAILLHELAHIGRSDYLWNAWQRAVEGLLFYHPAVWWISRVIRAERENCCDDVVVATRGNAREYAVALAALEESRCSGREPAVAATGGSLVKRIRRLLYPKKPNGAWTPLSAAAILFATAAVALAAWQSEMPQSSAAAQRQGPKRSPYLAWLNEDVVYIITAPERLAFLRLTSNAERDKFIEQFWLRRDPTPDTVENEFKEEHYRRIAYANQCFSSRKPGWQTDRGRVYIFYGPPDEIDDHPKAAPASYASQAWMYRYIEGVGNQVIVKFVDRAGTGDYQELPGSLTMKKGSH